MRRVEAQRDHGACRSANWWARAAPLLRRAAMTQDWVIVEDDRRAPDYWAYIVLARGYEHLDQPGDLLLSFVGGRLMETRFYPSNQRAYVVALRQAGIAVALEKSVMTALHVRVSMGRDERADYVAWLDLRLEEQAWRAIKRHS
jgi:hypothetical protein